MAPPNCSEIATQKKKSCRSLVNRRTSWIGKSAGQLHTGVQDKPCAAVAKGAQGSSGSHGRGEKVGRVGRDMRD